MGDHDHHHPGAEEEGGCAMNMLVSYYFVINFVIQ